jgi:hypothetical protein
VVVPAQLVEMVQVELVVLVEQDKIVISPEPRLAMPVAAVAATIQIRFPAELAAPAAAAPAATAVPLA